MIEKPQLTRRRVLTTGAGVAAAAAAVAVAGGALSGVRPAAAHGTLAPHNEIRNVPTYRQDLTTGAASRYTYGYQPNLYAKLEEWLAFHYVNTPPTYTYTPVNPGAVCLAGVHDDDDSGSMHYYGRAADIGTLVMWHSQHQFAFDAFNARYHIWRNSPQMAEYRRRYWGVVMSMNKYFKYVLHYHFDKKHETHVHVDNQASNGTLSTFTTDTRSQVKAVQAACNYIYNQGTTIDGSFGDQTLLHSSQILALTGWTGSILTSQAHWHRFCWAAMRSGHNLPIAGVGLTASDAKQLPVSTGPPGEQQLGDALQRGLM